MIFQVKTKKRFYLPSSMWCATWRLNGLCMFSMSVRIVFVVPYIPSEMQAGGHSLTVVWLVERSSLVHAVKGFLMVVLLNLL